jgi:hypothetical protein
MLPLQEVADKNLLALTIALDHPALSADPEVLCAAARACKAWREAVQQCGVCNTVVCLHDITAGQMQSFSQWLPKHAPLVMTIRARAKRFPYSAPGSEKPWECDLAAAQQLLHTALQLAAVGPAARPPAAPGLAAIAAQQQATAATAAALPCTASAAAAAAAEPAAAPSSTLIIQQQQQQPPQQQQPGLRLTSFATNLPSVQALLSLLPAHSLTHLDLRLHETGDCSSMTEQLERLSSLRQLKLDDCSYWSYRLDGLTQLTGLTSSQFKGEWQHKLLPPNVQCLCLGDVQRYYPNYRDDLVSVLNLQQLQHLTISFDDSTTSNTQKLLQLAQLPRLQTLRLSYDQLWVAADDAPSWPLSQLRHLSVRCCRDTGAQFLAAYRHSMAAVLSRVAAATQLTSLQLGGLRSQEFGDEEMHPVYQPVTICADLARLTGLQALVLSDLSLVPGDALALTKLSSISCLKMGKLYGGVGGAAAVELARSLTHLCLLECMHCDVDLGSMELMTSVGQLTQLYLKGTKPDGLTLQGLMQLTGLQRLVCFGIDTSEEVTPEVVRCFCQKMPQSAAALQRRHRFCG